MHWWADGGVEGYMVSRLNPKTGKPVCLKKETCYVGPSDTLFATDSALLNRAALDRLKKVFTQKGVFGYAVYGHTDNRASHAHNQRLSEQRAAAVATYGRSVGAVIEYQAGFGETRPRATNRTAAGMQQNRRVEIVCYKW
ncbi:MAG: OmpA family protein [Roseivivax sp.]|nr:OmpA family protein [Roseivivax sp.]